MVGELIPMVCSLGMFAMIFGIVYLKSRENMALIEKGMNPRMKEARPRPFQNLKWGLLLVGSGLGLLIAYLMDNLVLVYPANSHGMNAYDENPAIYFALIAIGGGLGLFFSYRIEKKEWLDKNKVA